MSVLGQVLHTQFIAIPNKHLLNQGVFLYALKPNLKSSTYVHLQD